MVAATLAVLQILYLLVSSIVKVIGKNLTMKDVNKKTNLDC